MGISKAPSNGAHRNEKVTSVKKINIFIMISQLHDLCLDKKAPKSGVKKEILLKELVANCQRITMGIFCTKNCQKNAKIHFRRRSKKS